MTNLYTEIEKSAAEHPDAVFLTYGDLDLTYEQVLAGAGRLAGKLREIAPGDSESDLNIGLFAPNLPGFVVGFFGTLAANKVTVPINFLLSKDEIMTIGMHAGLRILIASGPLFEKAQAMAQGLPITVLNADEFLAPTPIPDLPAVTRGDDDTAVLMYTSGTTGAPKGVELTHNNILANCNSVREAWTFSGGQTFVCVLPLFHSFGMLALMVLPGMLGARVVLVPQFQPKALAEIFSRFPDCIFFGVAPMYQVLALMAKTKGVKYPNLNLAVAGAAALPNNVKTAFEEATGIELFQGYGLSEASPVVSINLPGAHKSGAIGRPVPGVEVQIWDEDCNQLATGEIGELMVQGGNVMKGYYKNPDATAEAITSERWLHTGDLASIDEEGFITIAGRKKELIICAGENIYPNEIEDVLMSHPAVADAAVIGIPHDSKCEVPKAFVALHEGVSVEVSDLRNLCKEKLAAFKVPADFEVREELPKSPTGKVLKRLL